MGSSPKFDFHIDSNFRIWIQSQPLNSPVFSRIPKKPVAFSRSSSNSKKSSSNMSIMDLGMLKIVEKYKKIYKYKWRVTNMSVEWIVCFVYVCLVKYANIVWLCWAKHLSTINISAILSHSNNFFFSPHFSWRSQKIRMLCSPLQISIRFLKICKSYRFDHSMEMETSSRVERKTNEKTATIYSLKFIDSENRFFLYRIFQALLFLRTMKWTQRQRKN